MQQPILVPLDGSALAEQALPYARTLAAPGCQLILLEVGEIGDDDVSALDRHAGPDICLESAVGDPAEQILEVAKDRGVGLIVMTTHGRGAVGRWVFGSVADAVTRTAPVPVLVVHPRDGNGAAEIAPVIQRVVVLLDGSLLAEEALPTATSLARRLEVPVHLLTVVAVPPVALVSTVPFDAALYEETEAHLEADAEARLIQTSARLRRDGVMTTWQVLQGSPFQVITDAAETGDLIVMTSHGRGGAMRWLRGSVAETLIREGPAPVLLVPAREQVQEVLVDSKARRVASPVST